MTGVESLDCDVKQVLDRRPVIGRPRTDFQSGSFEFLDLFIAVIPLWCSTRASMPCGLAARMSSSMLVLAPRSQKSGMSAASRFTSDMDCRLRSLKAISRRVARGLSHLTPLGPDCSHCINAPKTRNNHQ